MPQEKLMPKFAPHHRIGTIAMQAEEGENPHYAHITPIYQSTTFLFPDVGTGQEIFMKERPGYYYSRVRNPNVDQLAKKYALLEGIDLIRAQPERAPHEIVAGKVFASGMAAITTAILAKCQPGDTIIAQTALYSHTFTFLSQFAPKYNLNVVWVDDLSVDGWAAAFAAHPEAVLVYAETPVNPGMGIVDLAQVAEMADKNEAWLLVDNTFATPYCQRPLTLGAAIVVHSTTKYLSGHGLIVGGAVISSQIDFMQGDLQQAATIYGGSPSPFDAWQANIGLKTFGIRMKQHCKNTMTVAKYLDAHSKVGQVFYPGLPNFEGHEIARKQMSCFGGMLSFELKSGFDAGKTLMNSLRLITLAVSLGNIDSLIQHPASMTHHSIPAAERLKMGIGDGLVRFSVGVEAVEDILADLEQGLAQV
jgi:methionine-gamma-lyase